MPQLDIFAFSSEVFWLLLFLAGFFYIFITYLLPNLLYILKVRECRIKSLSTAAVVSASPIITLKGLGTTTLLVYTQVLRTFEEQVVMPVEQSAYTLFYVFKMTELNVHFYSLIYFMLNIKSIIAIEKICSFVFDVTDIALTDSSMFNNAEVA